MSSQRRGTRNLLYCGVVAGPFFLLIFAIQVFARSEFQFTRSEPSMLSLGPWGWVQIANFVIGGLLIVAGALGARRVLRTSKGGFWGSLLLGVFGFCQIGVGAFVTDPIRSPASTTFHGTMHLVFGGAGFTALMAACLVFVRTFASLRQRRGLYSARSLDFCFWLHSSVLPKQVKVQRTFNFFSTSYLFLHG